jgi:hypothetical protein
MLGGVPDIFVLGYPHPGVPDTARSLLSVVMGFAHQLAGAVRALDEAKLLPR